MSNSIKVVARFRPQNRIELAQGGLPIVKFETDDTCALDVCTEMASSRGMFANVVCSQRRPADLSLSIVCLT